MKLNVFKKFLKLTEGEKKAIRTISQITQKKKVKAYIVGGFARDMLLERPNFDIDCVVEGNALEVAGEFSKKFKKKVKKVILNKKFHTAKLILENFCLDFATMRKEFYPFSGALPEVKPSQLSDDIKRRDFTINAIYISINKENFCEIITPQFYRDLKNKIIRIFHKKSFEDDPTRILRALRFSARFDFKIERETEILLKKAIRENFLEKISSQRLRKEFFLIFEEPHPHKNIHKLFEYKLNKFLLPFVEFKNLMKNLVFASEIWEKYFLYFQENFSKPLFYLLVIFHEIPLEKRKLIKEKFLLQKKEIKNFLFEEKIIKEIKTELKKEKRNWLILLDNFSEEFFLFTVFLCEKCKKNSKFIFDYYFSQKFKKPFHTVSELARMGFGKNSGNIYKKLLEKRKLGEIKSKNEEFTFLKYCLEREKQNL
ncbi:MAG: CCA tRNA nucleotidyltransferase [Elusimicrobia bacterium]|nr:CCA tRNA nucleotidyltransferase [Elusimicrobiota bacterium]